MKRMPRRTFLRGSGGVMIALPFLEIMHADKAFAQTAPKRIMFLYIPNGANMPTWTPAQTGTNITLSSTLEPLQSIKSKVLIASGLNLNRNLGSGGGGDHGRGSGTIFTQAQIQTGTPRAAMSIDHTIARDIGNESRVRLLRLGMENTGGSDSWGTNAYTRSLSWLSATQPEPKEINPVNVFNQLFAAGFPGGVEDPQAKAELAKRNKYKKSVLDSVLAEANSLRGNLGKTDKQKIDEYLTSIREVEREIQAGSTTAPTPNSCVETPAPDNSTDYRERVRTMLDLTVLAFACDLTKVTMMSLGDEGSYRVYDFLGVNITHHQASHYQTGTDDGQGGDTSAAAIAKRRADLAAINKFHVEQLAYLLGKMNGINEGNGTMLDNSIVFYGASLSDPNSHSSNNLPIVLAGGSDYITGNRHVNFNSANVADLFVWMLRTMGTTETAFGGSSSALPGVKV